MCFGKRMYAFHLGIYLGVELLGQFTPHKQDVRGQKLHIPANICYCQSFKILVILVGEW